MLDPRQKNASLLSTPSGPLEGTSLQIHSTTKLVQDSLAEDSKITAITNGRPQEESLMQQNSSIAQNSKVEYQSIHQISKAVSDRSQQLQ
jgi:hypothetical protein